MGLGLALVCLLWLAFGFQFVGFALVCGCFWGVVSDCVVVLVCGLSSVFGFEIAWLFLRHDVDAWPKKHTPQWKVTDPGFGS